MPGSATVRNRTDGKKGRNVMAKCGNSGNTTEPHIHFDLQNTARFYSCIGVPILFSNVQEFIYKSTVLMVDTSSAGKRRYKGGYIHADYQ